MTTTPKTLTVEETDKLLEQLLDLTKGGTSWRLALRTYTMTVLMLDAGIRVGELVQLELRDLYFQKTPVKTLIVRPEIAKRKRERSVPMSVRAQDALRLYIEETPWLNIQYETSYAFRVSGRRKHLTTRQVERAIRSAAMKALGRPIHPHVLRHTFASRLMRITNIRTVQELLGHKNVSSTQIYTHPNEEDKKKAIQSLDHKGIPFANHDPDSALNRSVANGVNTPRANQDH